MRGEWTQAQALLQAARGKTVVVAGDLMLDEWIIGNASRISPEAPVPVVRLSERKTAPGGAANVVMNLLSLGARVRVCGVIGDDEAGDDLALELGQAGADVSGIVRDPSRPTSLKTRVVAQRQQMVRIDRESDEPFSREILDALAEKFRAAWDGASALCLSDYDKGFTSSVGLEETIEEARSRGLKITAGPKPLNMAHFARSDFLSLNQKEAGEAAGIKLDSVEAVECAGEGILAQTQAKSLSITRGSRGVSLFRINAPPLHIPAHAVEVFDVAGAGDTFLAAATLALAGGSDVEGATNLGNIAAAASVRHVGVVAIVPEDIRRVAEEKD
ncbi:MAG TPA: PfkB family carbohydrate kinase [Abditibacteriaceae bacterium]|jgi:D-beta-D-heptose 7-phosphate kinase/D-beta-D-heptose 1-phosphate adenosyltransferase